jgi:hypothetical protein
MRAPRPDACVRCRAPAVTRCDGPADTTFARRFGDGGRCNAPLCAAHAYRGDDGAAYCFHHRGLSRPPMPGKAAGA